MRSRPGFSLLELLVALVLFDVALLGLVATGALAARELRGARLTAAAGRVAARRLELLSVESCATAASGVAEHPDGMLETWVVSPEVRGVRAILDSVVFDHARGRSSIVVEGALRCR
jgi:Tfp pilus assembly protein PilV